ncbi:SMP-30/gluconolactonase/LRE family protein [Legionella longbeachae]|nr:SMP-30/gluconolactonase/LRE family protein [Legionella longbeachae]ARM33834.1 SMP-30/gluconolactonase/LRE family protein [Legionella longbeachae]QIN33697.1 SMP-30/gluconolactonase/LRE family protein [Legionella longbeachae]RZV23948.1 SMP-30/gluconolactonase/LRE family protein [Legionella longbeachae]UAK46999.1 SMP-30/gluconolactonase/LRE family protein [Legionella longbeachae]
MMNKLDSCYCELGESPVWNPIRALYHWVDINQHKIYSIDEQLEHLDVIDMPDKVGCIVVNEEGNLLAALSREIVKVLIDNKKIVSLHKPEISGNEMFNDGKVDAKGRFWVASKDIKETDASGKLYCYDGTHLLSHDEGFVVGNGIGWSLNNEWMYFTDSMRQIIYRYRFNLEKGQIKSRQVFAKVNRGYPDGLTVDARDHVWSANWDGQCLTHYDPEGQIIEFIELDNTRPTSCCFGGAKLNQLFITSAYVGLENPKAKDGLSQVIESLSIGNNPFLAKA